MAAPLRVFSGAEVSAREGHFLVYGLPSLDEVPPGVELAELLARRPRPRCRDRRRPSLPLGPAVRRDRRRAWAGLRCPGAGEQQRHTETRARTERLLRAHGHGRHRLQRCPRDRTLGCYFTEFDGRSSRSRDFVAALKVAARAAEASARGPPEQRAGLLGATLGRRLAAADRRELPQSYDRSSRPTLGSGHARQSWRSCAATKLPPVFLVFPTHGGEGAGKALVELFRAPRR